MFKSTVIYTLSSVLSAVFPFLLLPILTRILTPEEYGQIAMFIVFTSALGALVGLSLHGAANRRFFDEGVSDIELARFNGNCVYILLTGAVIALLVISFIGAELGRFLGIPRYWIYFGTVSVFFSFILNIRLGQWQIREQASLFGFTQVTNSLVASLFSLILIVLLNFGVDGRVYGITLTSAIFGVASYYMLRRDELILFEYNKRDFTEALAFGVPLIPHVLGGYLLLSIDRLVINKELGLEMTGIYMVAVSFGSVLNLVFNSINKAYSPWLFGKLKKNNEEEKIVIVKNTYMYFLFLMTMSFLAFYIAPPLLKIIVGERFYKAADILPLILMGQVFIGMYFMVTNYIFYVKKTKYLSYITIVSGLVNVSFLFLLTPYYGLSGAAIAFVISTICQFISTWVVSAKLYEMPWSLRRQ